MRIDESLASVLTRGLGLAEGEQDIVSSALGLPPNLEMGDFALPCFAFSGRLGKPAAAIAAGLEAVITPDDLIKKVEARGPYLNLYLNRPQASQKILAEVLTAKQSARPNCGHRGLIVLDFSHPNIAKPFHFGHLRSTNLGANLARIFESSGYQVFRKNYLGDWGTQFGYVIHAWNEYGDEDQLKNRTVDYLVQLYIRANQAAATDPSISESARMYFRRLENGDPDIRLLWRRFRDLSLQAFQQTYDRLGVHFDSFDGEAAISGRVDEVVDRFLRSGVARISEGAVVVDVR